MTGRWVDVSKLAMTDRLVIGGAFYDIRRIDDVDMSHAVGEVIAQRGTAASAGVESVLEEFTVNGQTVTINSQTILLESS